MILPRLAVLLVVALAVYLLRQIRLVHWVGRHELLVGDAEMLSEAEHE